ncbi:unnamed protein product [Didymodactylos carnosus]|uniref:Uncharacterized protein n=1 Tax=Didymodactylos carnosus TaxID=1234261 RepID=A0A815U0M5_9BILA|nr:unnamed protein product [Didymodactylos carnosus]CAF4375586.1 unnamed protein product [Didymodactylos carnosus]
MMNSNECNSPQITFAINNDVLSSARQIPQNQSFSIVAFTSINCLLSLMNTKQWTIAQCNTTNEQCSRTVLLDNILNQLPTSTTSVLYVPARTLAYGTYQLNYSVYMNARSTVSSYKITYISIIQSEIIVNLLPNDTSWITRDRSNYKYGVNNDRSILTIQPYSLQSNRTYEFKVVLTNIHNLSLPSTGYALVQVQDLNQIDATIA